MSYPYEGRTGRQQRSVLGYWIPVIVTATVATAGVVAWIIHERSNGEEDEYDYDRKDDRRDDRRDDGAPGPSNYGREGPGAPSGPPGPGEQPGGLMARMSGAIKRTPSPQQMFDAASKTAVAGMAAAGAVVGGALSSIREEDKDEYVDHSRWSEEAGTSTRIQEDGRRVPEGAPGIAGSSRISTTGGATAQNPASAKRKTVAIVISAETSSDQDEQDQGYHREEASVLSHLMGHIDPARSRVFILIYNPDMKQHPLSTSSPPRPEASISSSFSNIGMDEARTPGEEGQKPLASIDPSPIPAGTDTPRASSVSSSSSPAFSALYAQAQRLVEDETMIIPFTTVTGHVHLLRHIGPEVVYVQESLSGVNGDVVSHISGWVGQVLVVVGAEGGHGGLIDSEDEAATSGEKDEKWWQRSDRVGLGKGVEVVEGLRVGEDWMKRVGGLE